MNESMAELGKEYANDIHLKLLAILEDINDNFGNIFFLKNNKLDEKRSDTIKVILELSESISKDIEQDETYLNSFLCLPTLRDTHAYIAFEMKALHEQKKMPSRYVRRHIHSVGLLSALASATEPAKQIIQYHLQSDGENQE
jgi:hypothetical protein